MKFFLLMNIRALTAISGFNMIGYSLQNEKSIIFGCHNTYLLIQVPSCLIGAKITGMLYQTHLKGMPKIMPCLTINDECVFLFFVTKFDDATTIKECSDCKDGEVVKHFENFEDAQGWFHCQFSVPIENDRNSNDDSGSMPGLLDRCFEDSDSDDDNDSMPELEDRYSDSDDNSKQPTSINGTLLAISKVVMKKEIEEMKQVLVESGRKIPAKAVDVLCLINTPHLY